MKHTHTWCLEQLFNTFLNKPLPGLNLSKYCVFDVFFFSGQTSGFVLMNLLSGVVQQQSNSLSKM